jgi:sigma-B regulation protein RsbU (phosphoserine phosphatase)
MWPKFAFLVLAAVCASAQDVTSYVASSSAEEELNGVWRWHKGDNMQWSSPSFDDSKWSSLKVGPLPDRWDIHWIRLHVRITALREPALLLGPIASSYEVYWDGARIGSFGTLSGTWFIPRWQVFAINSDAKPGDHILAVRAKNVAFPAGGTAPRFVPSENRIGERATLDEAAMALLSQGFRPYLLRLLLDFAILLAGIYFLLLPQSVSDGSALRWFGGFLTARAIAVVIEFTVIFGPHTVSAGVMSRLIAVPLRLLPIFWIEFAYALFRRRPPFPVRVLEALMILIAATAVMNALETGLFNEWIAYPVTLIGLVPPIAVAWSELRKHSPGAMIQLAFFLGYSAAMGTIWLYFYGFHVPTGIYLWGFRVGYQDLVMLLLIPVMTTQIHKTNQQVRAERERLRGEMEAAQQVQEVLLPSRVPHVPGFEIETAYRPAFEVGGDFFQLFPALDGGVLVVVGDVSGKGMKAALLVSLIVGILQNRKSDKPSAVLAEINSALLGRSSGGFTTCCCARFDCDGALTMANGGHLAPYRNGHEIKTPPGLPLGIDADARWTEMHIDLDARERIVWISDGVVEARNGKRDLLGFERAEELATRSASEIARAAQQFGQDDDITVVSITRQAVAACVA